MKITLNGELHEIAEQSTLESLLQSNGLADKRVAVEINRAIIPRSVYRDQEIKAGDRIEIVHAIGGG